MKQSEIGERVTARGILVVGACAAVVTIAAACGGKVTWVEDGPANTGGAGSGTQSTGTKMSTSTSTTKPTTVSSSTGVSTTACEKLCMIPGCANGSPTGCVTDCIETFYTPGCESQADAFLTCAASNVDPMCEFITNACDGLQSAYEQCSNPGDCSVDFCSQDEDGSCSCEGTCFGSPVNATCKTGSNGIFCSCTQNGMEIGTCTEPELSCGLESSCCAQFFVPFD